MKDLSTISSVYFLGIGGIGMSVIARYFNERGVRVSGYDKTPTPLTDKLSAEGISIHFEDDVEKADTKADLIIYTPAIPKDHRELNWFKDNDVQLFKRSEILAAIVDQYFSICVAGTHGKTTTSAMIAHILRHSGHGCNAFLGGIAANYDSNFWSSETHTAVAEADEYDRSFLRLKPNIAVITSMDADHLDIYGTEANMQSAFIEFASRVRPGGTLFIKHGIARRSEFLAVRVVSYSLQDKNADVYAEDLTVENGEWHFNIRLKNERLTDLVLPMGGRHNAENATVAAAVALQLNIAPNAIRGALRDFRGVKRRFEYIVRNAQHVMIDDYAHHPEELRALIEGAKTMFPGKKCTVVFQPHLFSRTRDLAKGFSEVLSMPDQTVLLPIYPARELPIEGVSSAMIAERISGEVTLLEKHELNDYFANNPPELLITAGAGDIDALVEPIKKMIA